MGKETLGFTKDDVGLHFIRWEGAMAMFLSGVSTIIIQRVGRWESDAFMEYIREQVNSPWGCQKEWYKMNPFITWNFPQISMIWTWCISYVLRYQKVQLFLINACRYGKLRWNLFVNHMEVQKNYIIRSISTYLAWLIGHISVQWSDRQTGTGEC